MTNSDFNPAFRGKFLQTIVDIYCPELPLDPGTILVQEAGDQQVFFQLRDAYIYRRSKAGFSNGLMPILPGSAIDSRGEFDARSKFCLAQRVRIPSTYELEWYYKQDTV